MTNCAMENMENIFTVAKPFLSFAKILGLFPMTFVGHPRKGILEIKWHDVLLSFCSFTGLICLMFINLEMRVFLKNDSKVLFSAWFVLKLLDISSYMCLFAYQLCKRKNVLNFLDLLNSVDEEVSSKSFSLRFN